MMYHQGVVILMRNLIKKKDKILMRISSMHSWTLCLPFVLYPNLLLINSIMTPFLVSTLMVTMNFQRATWPLALLTSWPRIRPQGASTLQSLVMRTPCPCSSSSCSTSSCSVMCANTRRCSKIKSVIRYFKRNATIFYILLLMTLVDFFFFSYFCCWFSRLFQKWFLVSHLLF